MMNKQKTNKAAVLKYMLIVPLVLSLVLVANAQSVVKKTKKVVATTGQKSTGIAGDSTKASVKFVPPVKSTAKFVPPVMKKDEVVDANGEKVYDQVDKMPQYPGGDQELFGYLAKNIKYPSVAQQLGTQGTVIIRFVVNKVGGIERVKVLKTVRVNETNKSTDESYKLLEKEAVRVVNAMPQWTPGEQKGEKVAVHYVLPIKFTMNDGASVAVSNGKLAASTKTTTIVKRSDPKPLYIVDGKEISDEEFKAIKPADIQKIDVLKNESATKVYGDKGANGVVLITMKQQNTVK